MPSTTPNTNRCDPMAADEDTVAVTVRDYGLGQACEGEAGV